MKIYLLNPPFLPKFVRCGRWQGGVARSGGLDYPKWLAYATGVLEEQFREVRLIDAVACNWKEQAVVQDAKNFKPDLIVADSNFSSLSNDINVATSLKERTGAKTVLVGPPASQFPEKILQSNGVDVVARFEYDFTLKDIAKAMEDDRELKEVKGISYKKNGKIIHNPNREFTTSEDLDRVPFVSKVYKKHLNIQDYFLSQSLYPEVQIFTGRGCPHRCTFCSWPETLMGRKYRVRSAENIVDEFQYISKEMPEVREIFIEDDTFTINQNVVRAVCAEIQRRKLKLIWSCNARASLNYETMKEMKRAGCRLIIVGYESGSDEILQNIKKGITTDEMRIFTRDAKKAGLLIHGDFIIGLPGETKKTAEETLRFIKDLKPNILQVAVATPIPGTEFYNWVKENGFLLTENLEESLDEGGFQKCIVSYPGFTQRNIEEYVDKALKEYYLSFSYVTIAATNIFRRNGLHELKGMLASTRVFLQYLRRKKALRGQSGMRSEEKTWDKFWGQSELWLTALRFTPTYRKIVRIFRKMAISQDVKILDIGCGSGKLTQFWYQTSCDVLGIDISDEALKFTNSKGIKVIKASVRNLPFKDGEFELVYSDGLLEHFPDPEPILAEIFRVSKKYIFTLIPRTTLLNKALVTIFRIPKQYDKEGHEWIELHKQFRPESIKYGNAFTMFFILCEKKAMQKQRGT